MVNPTIWQDCSETISPACLILENWFNKSLTDGEFGSNLDQISFMVIALEEDPEQNVRRSLGWDKLATYKHPISSMPFRVLSFGISLPYNLAASLSTEQARSEIARLIATKVAVQPKRIPKGLDYPKLANSIQAAAKVFTAAA